MPESLVDRLLRLLDQQADEVLEAERLATRAASGPLRRLLEQLIRDITRLWVQIVGSLDTEATDAQRETLSARLRPLFDALAVDPREDLYAAATAALGLGVEHAMQQAGGQVVDTDRLTLPREVDVAIDRLPGRIRAQIDLAWDQQAAAVRHTDLLAAAQQVERAANRADANARWAVNRAVAAGTQHAAKQLGTDLVWRAERDGCLHCLAYAGRIDKGDGFPGGLTYSDKPLSRLPVPGPPLHPNCRCQLALWDDAWLPAGGGPSLADQLAREALRSVLKGWGQSTDAAALRAAARAIRQARTDLPKTVVDEAVAAVRRGEFKSRDAP